MSSVRKEITMPTVVNGKVTMARYLLVDSPSTEAAATLADFAEESVDEIVSASSETSEEESETEWGEQQEEGGGGGVAVNGKRPRADDAVRAKHLTPAELPELPRRVEEIVLDWIRSHLADPYPSVEDIVALGKHWTTGPDPQTWRNEAIVQYLNHCRNTKWHKLVRDELSKGHHCRNPRLQDFTHK